MANTPRHIKAEARVYVQIPVEDTQAYSIGQAFPVDFDGKTYTGKVATIVHISSFEEPHIVVKVIIPMTVGVEFS